jgi:hypothetical protein
MPRNITSLQRFIFAYFIFFLDIFRRMVSFFITMKTQKLYFLKISVLWYPLHVELSKRKALSHYLTTTYNFSLLLLHTDFSSLRMSRTNYYRDSKAHISFILVEWNILMGLYRMNRLYIIDWEWHIGMDLRGCGCGQLKVIDLSILPVPYMECTHVIATDFRCY